MDVTLFTVNNKCFLFSETAQLEAQHNKAEQEASELKKEKILLENQLEMEKMRLEAEKKKVMLAHEQLREKVQNSINRFVHLVGELGEGGGTSYLLNER